MTWGELLKQGQERLKKAGIQEYELDAWYLFERAFSMSRGRGMRRLRLMRTAWSGVPAGCPSSISWAHRNSWAWSFLSMPMC